MLQIKWLIAVLAYDSRGYFIYVQSREAVGRLPAIVRSGLTSINVVVFWSHISEGPDSGCDRRENETKQDSGYQEKGAGSRGCVAQIM